MTKKIQQEKVKVAAKKRISAQYFKIVLAASSIARRAVPGQFLEVKVSDGNVPLLRRPLSIHRIREQRKTKKYGEIELLCEIKGEATRILAQKKSGEYLDIIGPLGRGFTVPMGSGPIDSILVAGGMGVAPLFFLAEKIRERKTQNAKRKTLVLIGANTKNQLLCEREFVEIGCEVKVATDDGSRGFKGRITGLLEHLLSAIRYPLSAIYACGPRPMLREVSRLSAKHGIPAEISLEEHMSCGIGACLGCAVNTQNGFQRVCKEGPVFKASEIIWE